MDRSQKLSRRDLLRLFRPRAAAAPAPATGGFDLAAFYRQRQILGLAGEPPPPLPDAPPPVDPAAPTSRGTGPRGGDR
jgi:hypothetical protein